MLKFIEENKKVRLWYRFDSDYVGEEYEKYDFDEFHYDIDIEDAKDTIVHKLLKIIDEQEYCSSSVIVKALDELESCKHLEWVEIIKSCEDMLIEENKMDAMDYFAEKHHVTTKEEYDEIEWEGSRCE